MSKKKHNEEGGKNKSSMPRTEVSYEEYLAYWINSIETKHPKVRQASKS